MSSGRIWYPCRVRHCKSDWPPLCGTRFLRSCLPPQRGERREGGPCRSAEPLADWLPRLLIVQVPPVEGGYCEGPAEVEAAGGLLPRVLLWPLHPLPLQRLTLLQGFWSPLFLLAAGPTDPARSVWSTCFLPALSSPPCLTVCPASFWVLQTRPSLGMLPSDPCAGTACALPWPALPARVDDCLPHESMGSGGLLSAPRQP